MSEFVTQFETEQGNKKYDFQSLGNFPTAKIGQMLRVTAVDENDNPTAWEMAYTNSAKNITIVLPSSNWVSNSQTISNELFISSGYSYIVTPDFNDYIEYASCMVRANNVINNGEITFVCENIPTTDISVNIQRNEVQ